jgi:hypothetical protein
MRNAAPSTGPMMVRLPPSTAAMMTWMPTEISTIALTEAVPR